MSLKHVEDFYPLSPMQQGMLFHAVYAPETGVYVGQLRCTIRGSLDTDAFARAWQRVVERQHILRTGFVVGELKEPVQVVHRRVDLPLIQHDWRGLDPAVCNERLAAFARDDHRHGFDLATPPLLRLALIRTGDQAHEFVWTYHHILFDGWSLPLLLHEVLVCYESLSRGRDANLPPVHPFRQYIAWLHKQPLDHAEAFWRETLRGFDAPTPLVVDQPPEEPDGGPTHAELSVPLPATTTARLQALARQHQLTLNTLVQGAWALLLSRYSGENDIVFGATVAGRPTDLPGAEQMIGLFINTLPVRARLDPATPALDWLKTLQAEQVEARQYEYTPLVQIQGWSDVPRGVPLFESLLVFENFPVSAGVQQQQASGSLRIDGIEDVQQTNLPLTLVAYPGETLMLRIAYERARFDPGAIRRMLGHLHTLLEGIADAPRRPLGEFELLTGHERAALAAWNTTIRHFTDARCVHERVASQAARTPDAIAVRFGEQMLTYHELDRRANRLAHYLHRHDVGPDVLVGIYAEPSIALVVAVLGVLKAGGAFLPLDPAYPSDRLQYMLDDAQPRVVLAATTDRRRMTNDEQLALSAAKGRTTNDEAKQTDDRLPLVVGRWSLVDLAADWPAIAREPDTALPGEAAPDNLAYVIYTSGSTGRPKGTLLEHRGLANLTNVVIEWFQITPASRVLQFAAFGFDAAVSEIVPALVAGATLALAPRDTLADPEALLALLRAQAISIVTLPPSLLAVLPPDDLPALATVVSAGETCTWEIAERWAPGRRMLNGYGPTEATVAASYYQVGERVPATASVPIGRPIANAQMYILDHCDHPTPVGIPGELYIGGAGVARGYLNRPELTAERFVDFGFWTLDFGPDQSKIQNPKSKIYKTGDLARYLPDGTIEFLGRIDDQVKLRGFRIELGEIEAVLTSHPEVRTAAVVVREDQPGHKRLVAYVVMGDRGWGMGNGPPELENSSIPNTQHPTPNTQLRAWLRERLPEYMVPAAFVPLEALPLTPNGKVDRRALPAPEAQPGRERTHVAPRTPEEEVLAAIWAQLLGVPRVSADDNFFELGGHSLTATQLASRLREALKVELPLRAIFEAPTLAEQARRIQSARSAGPSQNPITAVPRGENLALSFAQRRLWFLDQLEPESPLYNIPSAVLLEGDLAPAALEQALNGVIARHEVLRTGIETIAGQPVQRIADVLPVAIPLTDLSQLPPAKREAEVARLATEEARAPFDLAQPPLLRAHLLRLGPREHVALFTMHHIASDGWSMGVLVSEIATLYAAAVEGRPALLPPLAIQYADYAAWQREWLQGETLATQIAYWKRALDGAPPLLELPTDRPRPAVQSFRGASAVFPIPRELDERLRALSRQSGATLFMALLAGFQALLARYSRQDDILVGTPVAGRTRAELEPLIGFFVNTLVLRTDLSDDPSFKTLLRRVRETALGAYAHQDLPFEMVVDELQPERDLSHTPLFQVMFALQNAAARARTLPGLTISAIEAHSGSAKFDLTLEILDDSDGLAASFEYNTDLFDAATIVRLADHYQRLLDGAAASPDTPISRHPLLAAEERHELIVGRNRVRHFPANMTLHSWFAQQAARTPDAPAVTCEGRTLSYRELDERANQLAHLLQEHGVGPDSLVALRLDRSVELVVAILATLKAGGAYLPIDLAYPADRVSFMLEDARPVALIVDGNEPLDSVTIPLVDLSTATARIAAQPPDAPASDTTPDSLAYVIYTSGSTGKPKGCQVTHANVVRLFTATDAWYGFGPGDVWTLFHSYAFDFSVWEIWGALLYGGRLVVVPYHVSRDPQAFYGLLASEGVTVLNQTPSAFRQLMRAEEQLGQDTRLALRYVIFGGEALEFTSLRPWFARHGDARPQLVNMYGITETTVHVTYRPLTRADLERSGSVIGVPIPDLTLYVLDKHRQPVPVGVPGELYVGGAGVARGYLNRPDLTAERFLDFAFDDGSNRSKIQNPKSKIYKTGDLARYLPDGDIEYLGRADDQVKIRGFRIELGEIETLLAKHPGVRETVVLVREDRPGDKRLVAYVVPTTDHRPPTNDHEGTTFVVRRSSFVAALRAYLKQHLPEYMVPAGFVPLERLPLTTNGKIDRRALPAPEIEQEGSRPSVVPEIPAEEALAAIWQRVLGVGPVGRHDNFFELGGDSILTIQVIALANEAGLAMTPRMFFEHPTVAELAAAANAVGGTLQIEAPRDGPAPLTPIQYWFFERHRYEPQHWNTSILLEVPPELDPRLLELAVGQLLAHHDALRLRFIRTEQGWVQEVVREIATESTENTAVFQRFDLTGVPHRKLRVAIETEAAALQTTLDLERGPLLRVAYFDLGARRSGRLLLIFHHLVIDGVSLRIVLADLLTVYQQLARGEQPQLPLKTSAFTTWAHRLAGHARLPAVQAELEYWTGLVGQPAPHLPLDYPGGANTYGTTGRVVVSLPVRETQALLRHVPVAFGTRIDDALLAALALSFARWTGQPRLLVELDSHGREDLFEGLDLSRTVGWFTSIYPVLLNTTGAHNMHQALALVHEQLRRVPNHGVGYGLLRYLGDEHTGRRLRELPYPEVNFNYLGQFDRLPIDGPADLPFRIAPESPGPEQYPHNQRSALIYVVGIITGGELDIQWSYSPRVHKRATIERLAKSYVKYLRELISVLNVL